MIRQILFFRVFVVALILLGLHGCANRHYPLLERSQENGGVQSAYHIGPGDQLQILVWKNPDLSMNAIVRPDGHITLPLINDIRASGKTPMALSKDLEQALSDYVKDPIVTVMLTNFIGTYQDTIRVVGEAVQPQSLPYREGMTVLDVMIVVGGLTDFAAGNRAVLVRSHQADKQSYRVRLDDLVRDGDISANAPVRPGDILIIPEAWF